MDVGKRLKSIRLMRGISQRELAKISGVTNSMISQIEQNQVNPSVGSLKKILDAIPISMGEFFTLESIKIKLDGSIIASHLYSDKQRQALARGGVQRLHMTNLNNGLHTLSAFFTGLGPNGRPYKRATELQFTKGKGSQYIELAIVDDYAKQEPVFTIKQW